MHNDQATAQTYPNQGELVLNSSLQYGEPMGSSAINKHMHNIASHGIYVGFDFKLAGGMKVTLCNDGDQHTLVARHKKATLTIHGQHPFTVEIPAGGEYFIVVDSFYNYGVKTKQVDINSTIDAASYKILTESELLVHHVILVSFNVPSGTTQLTTEMANIERRSIGGWGIEKHEGNYHPHPQYLLKKDPAIDSEKFSGKTAEHYLQLDLSRGALKGMKADDKAYLFIRTPQQGLLPFQPGSDSHLGTSSWPFRTAHAVTMFEDGLALNQKYLGIDATAKNAEQLNNKTNSVAEAPSTLVERDGESDISARTLRTSLPAQTMDMSPTDEMAFRRDGEHDNYMRHIGIQGLRNWIGYASLNESGLVQLSNSVSGSSEEFGATEKAVAAAYQCGVDALRLANDHTDEKFNQLLGNAPSEALNTLTKLGEKMSDNKDAIVVLTTTIAEKVPLERRINTVGPLFGGGNLKGDLNIGIKDASTSQKGAVQLTEDIESNSSILAMSARGLQKLYNIVKNKLSKETADTLYLSKKETAENTKLFEGLDSSAFVKKLEGGLHTKVWSGTSSVNEKRRYEIGRFTIDTKNWTSNNVIIVELFNTYYNYGGYKKYLVQWGYNQAQAQAILVEAFGDSNKEKLTVGEPVTISGNIKYVSLYVEQGNYNCCKIKLTTAFTPVTTNPPPRSHCYLFDSMPITVIESFTPDETVINQRNQQFNGYMMMSNYGLGAVGLYNPERFQNVFSMGVDANDKSRQYTMHPDGKNLHNFYGIAYTHSNNPDPEAKKISGHHAVFVENGLTKSAIGNDIWTAGFMYERGQILSERYLGKTETADKAVKLQSERGNYRGVTDQSVVGQLMWKHYGNHHTIFDASNGTTPTGVKKDQVDSDEPWTKTYPTLMGYNGDKTYGVRVDTARNAESVGGVKRTGFCRIYSGGVNTGAGDWTTAQFVEWLKSKGCFQQAFWMMKGSWSYANNKRITDTGIGIIHLAGCVIEVMGIESAYTIRVTTPSTSVGGGITNAQFTYINHGSDYHPGWRRDYNTKNPPPDPHIDIPDNRWQVVGAGASKIAVSTARVTHSLGRMVAVIDTKVTASRALTSTIFSENKDMMAVIEEINMPPSQLPGEGYISIHPVVRTMKSEGTDYATYGIYIYAESSRAANLLGTSFKWKLLQYKDWSKAQPM